VDKTSELNQSVSGRGVSSGNSGDVPTSVMECFFFLGLLLFVACTSVFEIPVQILTGTIFATVGASLFLQHARGQAVLWNMRNFILLGVLFWVLLDPLQMREGIDEFSYDVIVETLLYVVIFMVTVSVGYLFPPSRKVVRVFSRIYEPRSDRRVFWTVVLVYLIGIVPILYYSGGSLDSFLKIFLAGYSWDVDVGWRRGALGTGRDFLIALSQFFLIAAPFLATWALKRVRLSQWEKVVLLFMVVSVSSTFFFSGARRLFAFIVIGLSIYIYTAISRINKRRWRIIFLLVPFMLLWLMQIQLQYRAVGFQHIDLSNVETRLGHLHRDNNFYWMLMAVDLMPEHYAFTRTLPFLDFFIHPIPRFLWPGKPASEGYPFIRWEQAGATLSSSVIGDFYVAQGLLGVIIAGLFYGWAARNWNQLVRLSYGGNIHSLIYYMGGILLFFIGIRGIGEIVTQWYTVVLVTFIAYVWGKRHSLKNI
jgi:oligosaccharide repeat unit polymerase